MEKIQISFHSSKPGCRRTAQQEHPCTWIGSQSDIDARILACQIQRGTGPEVDEDGVLVVESNERPRQYFDYCYTITELDESGQKINELDPRVRVY